MKAAPKNEQAANGPASLPVVLTVTVPAQRRADLPDVFTAELEQSGRVVMRRHFRAGDGGGKPEDITELVAEILRSRARGVQAADRLAQAEQAARVGAMTPKEHRAARGGVVDEATAIAGQTRSRALSALGTIRQRDLLTTRQFEAGDRMAQDAKVMAGAREAKDEAALPPDANSGYAWEDFMVEAGRRLDLARATCQSMAPFEGVSPWLMVERVVMKDETLTDAAGGTSRSVQRRAKIALRIGLDAIGDAYKLPGAVTRTNVLLNGIPVPMTLTEDLDGRDRHEELQRLWRTIKLGDKPWVAVAGSMAELYEVAKKRLKERG